MFLKLEFNLLLFKLFKVHFVNIHEIYLKVHIGNFLLGKSTGLSTFIIDCVTEKVNLNQNQPNQWKD